MLGPRSNPKFSKNVTEFFKNHQFAAPIAGGLFALSMEYLEYCFIGRSSVVEAVMSAGLGVVTAVVMRDYISPWMDQYNNPEDRYDENINNINTINISSNSNRQSEHSEVDIIENTLHEASATRDNSDITSSTSSTSARALLYRGPQNATEGTPNTSSGLPVVNDLTPAPVSRELSDRYKCEL